MSHFSMSLSSADISAIPCGAHLDGFPCLCFSRSTLLALPPHSSLSLSLSLSLSIHPSVSGKVHPQSQVVESSGVSWWKPRGNVLVIAFILLKMGPFFSFVFSTARHSCLHNSIPTALQMDFPPVFLQPLLPLQICGDYLHSCNLLALAYQKKRNGNVETGRCSNY